VLVGRVTGPLDAFPVASTVTFRVSAVPVAQAAVDWLGPAKDQKEILPELTGATLGDAAVAWAWNVKLVPEAAVTLGTETCEAAVFTVRLAVPLLLVLYPVPAVGVYVATTV
jgi:hypothetical protein